MQHKLGSPPMQKRLKGDGKRKGSNPGGEKYWQGKKKNRTLSEQCTKPINCVTFGRKRGRKVKLTFVWGKTGRRYQYWTTTAKRRVHAQLADSRNSVGEEEGKNQAKIRSKKFVEVLRSNRLRSVALKWAEGSVKCSRNIRTQGQIGKEQKCRLL